MSAAIPVIRDCAPVCAAPTCPEVPGPQGEDGIGGSDGTNGINAFTFTTAPFTMPACGDSVTIDVEESDWVSPNGNPANGQNIHIQSAGYFFAETLPSGTQITIQNICALGNAAPGTVIPDAQKVSPAGIEGPAGAAAPVGGALLAALNLSDVADAATCRVNVGLGSSSVLTAAQVFQVANNLSEGVAATKRANLGLAIGTNVEAWDALLDAISALVTVADRLPYFTGVDTVATTTFTAFARTLLDDANAATMRTTIGVTGGTNGYVQLKYVVGTGVGGGATGAGYTARPVNTTVANVGSYMTGLVGATDFKLASGTYRLRVAAVTGGAVTNQFLDLYNVTAGAVVASSQGPNASTGGGGTEISAMAYFTIAAENQFQIRHYSAAGAATGMGAPMSIGGASEVYMTIEIEKES